MYLNVRKFSNKGFKIFEQPANFFARLGQKYEYVLEFIRYFIKILLETQYFNEILGKFLF